MPPEPSVRAGTRRAAPPARPLRRLAWLVLLGALCGPACLTAFLARSPGFDLDVGRDLPRFAAGFHGSERAAGRPFVWTTARATVTLAGVDRRVPWTCAVSFRGARSPQTAQPDVSFGVDGVVQTHRAATNDFLEAQLTVPARPDALGLVLTIASMPTFVPGGGDRRELGVQIDRLSCRPEGSVRPPRQALRAAAVAGGLAGATLALLALPIGWTAAATAAIVAATALALARGPAPYGAYPDTVAWTTFWVALASCASALLVRAWRRRPLSIALRVALAVSAASLLLELIALLHPMKLTVDALFHAHRLEWVLEGRYFFTQPMPGGVRFPYAIALYVAAAPFSLITHDYVALLKIVVAIARAVAGLALYPMVARSWNNRPAAALAVALFHVVPLPFIVIGNANLTYAFGQSVATLAIVAATTAVPSSAAWRTIALAAIASVAFLSHVGVFPVLAAMLVALGVLYRLAGGTTLRPDARIVIIAAVVAAVAAVVLYYGRFGESYATLERVRAGSTSASSSASGARLGADRPVPVPVRGVGERTARVVDLAGRSFGWPVLVLAAAGAWRVRRSGSRDRLTLLLLATGAIYLVFVGLSVAAPIRPGFQRYAEEFISRVNYLAIPAVVALAARGAVWAFRASVLLRVVGGALLLAAATGAVQAWLIWIS